jgi:hypothetical protein
MSGPWLSVIVPTWQGAAYVGAALESVAAQADAGVEVIAWDDGSTDATVQQVEAFASRLALRVVRGERSGNWVANTNAALRLAAGEHVCFLHQDDLWLPGRVAALRTAIDAGADFVTAPSLYLDEAGAPLGPWRCPLPGGELPPRLLHERLIVQNFFSIGAPAFRRRLLEDLGPMDPALWYTADWELWLRLAAAPRVVHVPRALAGFRLHRASQTVVRTGRSEEVREQLETVLARHGSGVPSAAAAAARASAVINVALFARLHGDRIPAGELLRSLASLGPAGLWRLARDARLPERIGARARLAWRGRLRGGATGP